MGLTPIDNGKAKKKPSRWSDYQGRMNWKDAIKKCASIGMRLPTRKELMTAHRAKATEYWKTDWEKSYAWYWTSEEHSADIAYSFIIDDGRDYYFLKEDHWHVRCIP